MLFKATTKLNTAAMGVEHLPLDIPPHVNGRSLYCRSAGGGGGRGNVIHRVKTGGGLYQENYLGEYVHGECVQGEYVQGECARGNMSRENMSKGNVSRGKMSRENMSRENMSREIMSRENM